MVHILPKAPNLAHAILIRFLPGAKSGDAWGRHIWKFNRRVIPNASTPCDNCLEENNLKALTQQRRGNGSRTRIGDGRTPIPKHEWNSVFLKNEENKRAIFVHQHTDFQGRVGDRTLQQALSQIFSRTTTPRRTAGSSCIWHMPLSRVIRRHTYARWIAMLLFWQSVFSRRSVYRNFGWALALEKRIVTFLFITYALISVRYLSSTV